MLQQILDKCKCGVYLSVNTHRDYYQSVEEYFADRPDIEEGEISPEVLEKMKELNTIIDLTFYPDTPIGSYSVIHYDLQEVLTRALQILNTAY